MPFNEKSEHWFLVMCDMDNRKAVLLDSLGKHKVNQRMDQVKEVVSFPQVWEYVKYGHYVLFLVWTNELTFMPSCCLQFQLLDKLLENESSAAKKIGKPSCPFSSLTLTAEEDAQQQRNGYVHVTQQIPDPFVKYRFKTCRVVAQVWLWYVCGEMDSATPRLWSEGSGMFVSTSPSDLSQ